VVAVSFSRFQPEGPHGPSRIVDPARFQWTDREWCGIALEGQVIYEMHIGTFTPEGTWDAARRELPELARTGITVLEIMPVADFPGRFGWGYDGVGLFAPVAIYGEPGDFRRFIDEAHRSGLAVILDVVYNHVGPDGNYLKEFAPDYFSTKHKTDWGEALNFDGPNCGAVRDFYLANARYWVEEYHLDGFRFDATQNIYDDSDDDILAAIARAARAAAGRRKVYLVGENEPQHTALVRPPDRGGRGIDALWNDDFHHSAMVALTGHNEAYYTDHLGSPQEFISAAKWGYLYQGQRYKWQEDRRGTPALDLPPAAFVNFIQNHDQVANSGQCLRAHALSGLPLFRAMTAVLLLSPQTPMLFQGQEFASSSPFRYFADQNPELARLVREGRAKELSQFPSVATEAMTARLLDPADRRTFDECKLDPAERDRPPHVQVFQMHKDLLKLRREEAVFRRVAKRGDIDGAALGPAAFVLRYFAGAEQGGDDDRLLVVNFGRDLPLTPAPEPLLAPPWGKRWSLQWSSEDPRYGGGGTPAPDTEKEGWLLPGRCAMVLRPLPAEEATVQTRVKKAGAERTADCTRH